MPSKFSKFLSSLDKFISRKLIVWIVSTVFFGLGHIDADQWFGITMTYIGVEGGADVVTRFKNKKLENKPQDE